MTFPLGPRALRVLPLAALTVAASAGFATVNASAATAAGGAPIYNSTTSPLPGNFPSVGPEAYAFSEFGNEINTTGVSHLGKVTVTLSTWGCQTGSWTTGNCSTAPGATFTEPITLNIYNAPAPGSSTPGTLIASATNTFTIPYRPSANLTRCTGSNLGKWWQGSTHTCFNGKAVNIKFSLGLRNLPSTVVYGIAYNTTHYGYHPIGEGAACFTTSGGCGYDSLNIALSNDDIGNLDNNVTVGNDTNPGTVWQNSANGAEYCDGGAAGTGTFRLDSPAVPSCWAENGNNSPPYYVPAVTFSS